MNIWKAIVYLCAIGVLVVAILWLVDGMQIYTKTGSQVITIDELWGTKEVKWIPDFQLGLLPSAPSLSMEALSALPIAGILAVVGFIAFRISRRGSVPRP